MNAAKLPITCQYRRNAATWRPKISHRLAELRFSGLRHNVVEEECGFQSLIYHYQSSPRGRVRCSGLDIQAFRSQSNAQRNMLPYIDIRELKSVRPVSDDGALMRG